MCNVAIETVCSCMSFKFAMVFQSLHSFKIEALLFKAERNRKRKDRYHFGIDLESVNKAEF